jgi:transcriptional regulator GlxA family with amidase domain
VLDRAVLGGSGVHRSKLAEHTLQGLARRFRAIHADRSDGAGAAMALLSALIDHLGRQPVESGLRLGPNGHARIVQRARTYIEEHLADPISLDAIAMAAGTSTRTLNRAFADILGDTPQAYVRRLRLHRIRAALADDAEAVCTITLIANQWGIGETGRLSGRYRELFGELPSETLARSRRSGTTEA